MRSDIDSIFKQVWVDISNIEEDKFMGAFGLHTLAREDSPLFGIYTKSMMDNMGWPEDTAQMSSHVYARDMIFAVNTFMITKLMEDKESIMRCVRERILIQRESMLRTMGLNPGPR